MFVVCTVDSVLSSSPTTSLSTVLDSDRDTTFDDFDLETTERLEVTEMFHSSSERDLARSRHCHCSDLSRSRQGHRRSESDAQWSIGENPALASIDIPSSVR